MLVADHRTALIVRITCLQTHPRGFQLGIIDDLVAPTYQGSLSASTSLSVVCGLFPFTYGASSVGFGDQARACARAPVTPTVLIAYRTQDSESTFPQISHVFLLTFQISASLFSALRGALTVALICEPLPACSVSV